MNLFWVLWACSECSPKVILSIYRKLSCLSQTKNQLYPPCISEDWTSTFWPITLEPDFFQIWDWWWNISNNKSFHFRLFPRKTNDKIFQKIQKYIYIYILGPIWDSNLVKIAFLEKGLCQFLNIPIIFSATYKFLTHKNNMQIFRWPFTRKQLS